MRIVETPVEGAEVWNHSRYPVYVGQQERHDIFDALQVPLHERPLYIFADQNALRAKFRARMSKYLGSLCRKDPEHFDRRYFFRSYRGEEASKHFGNWLDAAWMLEKRIRITDLGKGDENFTVTLGIFSPGPFGSKLVTDLQFRSEAIEGIFGSLKNFALVTTAFTVKYEPASVRVYPAGWQDWGALVPI